MGKENDTDKVMIPRFKDKVMYISAEDSSTKVASSYVISSSFKGIVRLSPNNHNTTYEKNSIQLSITDENNLGTTYSDAIKFDSEVENAIQSEADITKRMIIGSDSDGYLVGFRVSDSNLEFDNLGVIGITQSNHLSIISTSQTPHDDVLLLNGERMPHMPNKVQDAANIKTYTSNKRDDTTEIKPYNFDTKKVKIKGDGDNSFLLYSTVTSDNKRFYKFQRTNYIIRELILEALMDFQTIPTGSIHWFPVTIKQFKSLVGNNGGRPNVSFHNTKPVDPLLRDFLLCDGRRYNNKDFPELAKILWKEPIHRWKKDGDFLVPFFDEKCNTYGAKDDEGKKKDYTFRVPDLRHQFISSTYIDGTTSVASGGAGNGIKTGLKNVVGAWCPDKTPPSTMEFREDRHAHFIAYGSYGKKYHTSHPAISSSGNKLWTDNTISSDINYNKNENEVHKINGDTPHVTLLHNHPYAIVGNTAFRGFGWRYNTPTARRHSGIDSIPVTMWFSRPNLTHDYDEWRQSSITLGKSSPDATASIMPSCYSDIDEEFSGNTKWDETYDEWSYTQPDLYGHESTPKYYAMLPFIKI